jgi:hypothetical protein
MLTLRIDKYKEPEPIKYTGTQYTTHSGVFTPKEIDEAKSTATLCGLEKGLVMEHTPTGHTIIILGFNDSKHIIGYKGKPPVIKALRKRQGYNWESTFTVDELLEPEYRVINTPPASVTC